MRKERDLSYLAVLGLIIFGMVLGVILVSEFNGNALSIANGPTEKIESTTNDDPAEGEGEGGETHQPTNNWITIAEKANPAVVSIYTTKEVKVRDNNPFFKFFHPNQEPGEKSVPQRGLGSGAIVSKDGYILTNNHVAGEVDQIVVRLTDKREFIAKLIGNDPLTDLAVIKIDSDDLPYLPLGDSDKMKLGSPVLAIGNPFNLTSTVTSGIVSALGRNIRIIDSSYGIENFIQTDAVINPGNSGGPLLNTSGEVIGINTAIQTNTGYYQGYGFAVPSNIAKNVMNELIRFGRVKRGYIGIQIRSIDAVMARGLGLDKPQGVLVESVQKDMPAEEAGIKGGDVVLEVNGVAVNEPNELQAKISSYNPGDKVSLTIWRNSEKIKLRVALKEREADREEIAQTLNDEKENIKKLGMEVADLSANHKEAFKTEAGVLVTKVDPAGAAANRGMMSRMVIIQVNSSDVKDVRDFISKVEKADAGDVLVFKVRMRTNSGVTDRLIFIDIPKE